MFTHFITQCDFDGASNKDERCPALLHEVQRLYAENHVNDRLQNLYVSMLQRKKTPKTRCSAASCRALVPFVAKQAVRFLGDTRVNEAIASAALHLGRCYAALGSSEDQDALKRSSMLFAAQVVALHKIDPSKCACKPMMHLFLELCSSSAKPARTWTYRDEDFGGSCAQIDRRRGGSLSPAATSRNLITRFMLKVHVLRL